MGTLLPHWVTDNVTARGTATHKGTCIPDFQACRPVAMAFHSCHPLQYNSHLSMECIPEST